MADHQTPQKEEGAQPFSRCNQPPLLLQGVPHYLILEHGQRTAFLGQPVLGKSTPWLYWKIPRVSVTAHIRRPRFPFSQKKSTSYCQGEQVCLELLTHPLRASQERQAKTKAGIPQHRNRLGRLGLCKETMVWTQKAGLMLTSLVMLGFAKAKKSA